MEKLNLSIGILSWKSPNTITNTLESYKRNGLLNMVKDVKIFFQEGDDFDKDISSKYEVSGIISENNVGIGRAFTMLAQSALTPYILFLENDWVCIEDADVIYEELFSGIALLQNKKADMIKYRHRLYPGDPLYTYQFANREMDAPKHLFDCVHWVEDPDKKFPEYIEKDVYTNFYICSSKYANHTNNPTMFKTNFYLDKISPFSGEGVDLEGKIDGWWQEQNFKVAHGKGLFTHYRIDRG
jgi:hypothetical protein